MFLFWNSQWYLSFGMGYTGKWLFLYHPTAFSQLQTSFPKISWYSLHLMFPGWVSHLSNTTSRRCYCASPFGSRFAIVWRMSPRTVDTQQWPWSKFQVLSFPFLSMTLNSEEHNAVQELWLYKQLLNTVLFWNLKELLTGWDKNFLFEHHT